MWNCCSERYGKFRVVTCFSFGYILGNRGGGRFSPKGRGLKQLAELKEAHVRTLERSSNPLVTHSVWGGFSHAFGGSEARIGPSLVRSKIAPKPGLVCYLLFLCFIVRDFGILGPPLGTSWLRHCSKNLISSWISATLF